MKLKILALTIVLEKDSFLILTESASKSRAMDLKQSLGGKQPTGQWLFWKSMCRVIESGDRHWQWWWFTPRRTHVFYDFSYFTSFIWPNLDCIKLRQCYLSLKKVVTENVFYFKCKLFHFIESKQTQLGTMSFSWINHLTVIDCRLYYIEKSKWIDLPIISMLVRVSEGSKTGLQH